MVLPGYIISCKSTENIYETHPILYIMAFGLVTAKITNKLVVNNNFYYLLLLIIELNNYFLFYYF